GNRHERPMRGADLGGLIVIDPVADVLDARGGEVLGRIERLREARSQPADRLLAGELLDGLDGPADHAGLVFLFVDRALLIAVAHEFPARILAGLRDARVIDAHARIDRDRRLDAEAPVHLLET